MVKLIWSPRAIKDLEGICEYIGKDSEYYAKFFAQKIVAIIEKIPEFPEIGRIVPEYDQDNLRERIFRNYRLVYRLKPGVIEIVAIFHGAKLLPEI
ncbi:MAG: type II toxin-antitoxin system RelE/ParE family toxin [bacterium (Candidatus Ratteibacteria) CG_4_10_14_3_um_filter_41_18]|uniref:Type II toxin-antitoxin system RelE/ParE family toxin n=4 Tax=Candidatus Ratteibacteria TaxID=2979319 RepID=A0A2M7YHE4_9BACT|nr:MAG: type II toxin-antitoxin system RelE/ParE family toxin [bacterium (Candidatus Ratteibacteria) CG01_land_8_20_14_3_00_40_19]PIW32642.1 MAG: type II toxin-antitoxin system RelE/ParE family toxin [bacterium (Candidatus Ratteibacteria) CG15_BIG_FIL_POST_REV_8_21_14_020_41_12]PIX77474.1 MAG: type II toxin-antitoxin system RelE/ParE family toxin [bacterium (Candidatus Ratteibacteria) CG_4_10_14_3_um_filter_41_18]PJA62393.1 MAG: type II toxin-antitoxin system RelE/ParE family toxin [bacterium (C